MKKDNVVSLFQHRQRSRETNLLPASPFQVDAQIPLPFSAPRDVIFVLASSFRGTDTFCRFVTAVGAFAIFDLRIAPRLDFIQPTRAQAFSFFERSRIDYKDMFGRFGLSSYLEQDPAYDPLWQSVASEIDSATSDSGPAMALCDDASFLVRSSDALSSVFAVERIDEIIITHRNENSELLRM